MRRLKRHLIGVLVMALVVSALPLSSYAAQGNQPTGKQFFTVKGTKYSIEKNQNMIRVEELKGGKAVNSCTAYMDDGYMLYEKNKTIKGAKSVTDVIWIDSMIKEINPTNSSVQRAPLVPVWTVDCKYVYKPTLVSLAPTKYMEHSAYLKFRNLGTKSVTRQINFAKGTAIPVMATTIGIIIGLVSYFAAPALAVAVTIDLIAGVGLDVSANRITNAFAPTLAVDATKYDTKFVDAFGNGTGQIFVGERLTVTDVESKRFNKSYYEGYVPQRSQNFGYAAFLNTFKGSFIKYPGLKSYIEL